MKFNRSARRTIPFHKLLKCIITWLMFKIIARTRPRLRFLIWDQVDAQTQIIMRLVRFWLCQCLTYLEFEHAFKQLTSEPWPGRSRSINRSNCMNSNFGSFSIIDNGNRRWFTYILSKSPFSKKNNP